MLLPEKLKITNYCQIPFLELDLSQNQVFAVTAPNGSGKSNTLNALKYALSGMASSGADKLIEDIRDGADKAIVELHFALDNNEAGHIKREISRTSGSSSCELTIYGSDSKIKEKITKSGGAEKRFMEILGVSPRHISEIIIAEQHSIEALLFWPATERGPKFQRFLHGQLFQEIEKAVQKESKKIFLDPHVEERRKSLLLSLIEPEETKKAAQKKIARIEKELASPEIINLLEKERRTKEFANLKTNILKLQDQKVTIEQEATNLAEQAKAYPKKLREEIDTAKKKIEITEQEWQQYRPYHLAQIQLTPLQSQVVQLQTKLNKQISEIEKEAQNKSELTRLKTQKTQYETFKEAERLKQIIQNGKEFIALADVGVRKHKTAIDKVKESLKKEATYNVIDQALTHMDTHKLKECLVCEGPLSEERITKLKAQHVTLKKELDSLHTQLDKETNSKISLEQEIHSIKKEVNAAEEQLKTITSEPCTKLEPEWSKSNEDSVTSLEHYFAILPTTKQDVITINEEIKDAEEKIQELKKIKPVTAPKCDETILQEKKKALRELEQKAKEMEELQSKIDTNNGQNLQLKTAIEEAEKEFLDKNLPASKQNFALTESETTKINNIIIEKTLLASEKEALIGALGSIKAITAQIAKADMEIKGYEETKAYSSDLQQLDTWFRYNGIPSQILHRQLNSLCAKMEGIISQFQLKQSFKLVVDESLDIHMKYPSGILRPIRKASGGERIILGIAFRLATHHFLAPELPLLAIDEPSNHLFETNQVILQEIIRGLKTNLKSYGLRKFIYCTHSRALANEAEEVIDLSSL